MKLFFSVSTWTAPSKSENLVQCWCLQTKRLRRGQTLSLQAPHPQATECSGFKGPPTMLLVLHPFSILPIGTWPFLVSDWLRWWTQVFRAMWAHGVQTPGSEQGLGCWVFSRGSINLGSRALTLRFSSIIAGPVSSAGGPGVLMGGDGSLPVVVEVP